MSSYAPRLVAGLGGGRAGLAVWSTGTGLLLGALPCPLDATDIFSLLTYQRPSDGRPRVSASFDGGRVGIWDGDDLRVLHTIAAAVEKEVFCLAVYEEPTGGSTRLVTG
jgi:hypothetical protein